LLTATNATTYINTTYYPTPTYTYQWYLNGNIINGATSSTYLVDTADAAGATRNYTVVMTSTSALGCSQTSAIFPVIQSGQAQIVGATGYTVTNAFSDNQTITVTVQGWGAPDYQYSLDDGPRQTSPVFENVSLGEHTITIWDVKGGIASSCDPLVIQHVQTIDYPHYFTPNGDGIHDTWNITGLDQTATIYIFDRFGKLIKQLSPVGEGWDGTYNGYQLPATDYWFTTQYYEQSAQKEFKAHFALKR
jgi:gliding motility-associated-like protein